MKWEMVPHYVTQASWDVSRKSWANSFYHGKVSGFCFITFPFHKCSIFTTSKRDRKLICQKVCQRISVMKTNIGVFVVFKTKCESKCQFFGITEILWRTFWHNNRRSVFDTLKILCYSGNHIEDGFIYSFFCPSPLRILIPKSRICNYFCFFINTFLQGVIDSFQNS